MKKVWEYRWGSLNDKSPSAWARLTKAEAHAVVKKSYKRCFTESQFPYLWNRALERWRNGEYVICDPHGKHEPNSLAYWQIRHRFLEKGEVPCTSPSDPSLVESTETQPKRRKRSAQAKPSTTKSGKTGRKPRSKSTGVPSRKSRASKSSSTPDGPPSS